MSWKDDFQRLLKAMVQAEGGEEAFIRAVRCSLPETKDFPEAMRIATNTVQHRLWDYAMRDPDAFIDFLGARWAPVGAANDPTNLNANWTRNVKAVFRRTHGNVVQ